MSKVINKGLAITAMAASLTMAGFGGSAVAADSITLYGIVNGGIFYDDTDVAGSKASLHVRDGHFTGRWGIKGREDIGGGLGAVFLYAQNIIIGQAAGSDRSDRFAYVGLTSPSFGEILIGRYYNPLYLAHNENFDAYYNKFINNPLAAHEAFSWSVAGFTGNPLSPFLTGYPSFPGVSKAIYWHSPRWGGLQIRAAVVPDTVLTDSDTTNSLALAFNYKTGGLTVAFGYDVNEKHYLTDTLGQTVTENELIDFSIGYKFGSFIPSFQWQRSTSEPATGTKYEQDHYALYLAANFSPHIVWLFGAMRDNVEAGGQEVANSKSTAYGIEYRFHISKRTSFGVAYQLTKNDSAATFGASFDSGIGRATAGADPSTIGLGIFHTF